MFPMAYEIKTIRDISEIGTGTVADIDVYNWGGVYRPVSKAILCCLQRQGFAVRLWSEERDPRATQTEPNSRVCEDSCLEFFANFAPSVPGSGYLNFEGNALGTMLCCYGPESRPGENRTPVIRLGCRHPRPRAFRGDGFWGWELLIPFPFLRAVYGDAGYGPGSRIRGGFFKCGDLTEHPHYGSYRKIEWPGPNFHRPEFFADMVVTG